MFKVVDLFFVIVTFFCVTNSVYAKGSVVYMSVDTAKGSVEISLQTDEEGAIIPNQLLFVHGDQASVDPKKGYLKLETAAQARKYFGKYADGLDFGVIMRPDMPPPNIRTKSEVAAVREVFEHLASLYNFTQFRVIAQSGAFPVVHGVAEGRSDFSCLVGASPVADHMAFFRQINPNTSIVWVNRYHDSIEGIKKLSNNMVVGLVHNPRDKRVAIESAKLYAEAAKRSGRSVATNFSATARDKDKHVTIGAAIDMFETNCQSTKLVGTD